MCLRIAGEGVEMEAPWYPSREAGAVGLGWAREFACLPGIR